jgi:hypothetical protein
MFELGEKEDAKRKVDSRDGLWSVTDCQISTEAALLSLL